MNKKLLLVTCSLISGAGLSACGESPTPAADIPTPTAFPTPSIWEIPEVSASATPSVTNSPSLSDTIPENEMVEMIDSLWGIGGNNDDNEEEQDLDTEASPTASPSPSLSPSPSPTLASPSPTEVEEPSPSLAPVSYRNGTYRATGGYRSPAGNETIEVELVIQNGEIINVRITPQARHETSLRMQEQFADGIGLVVIGRQLSELEEFASVNGSSLAPEGFDRALRKIRDEAAI